MDNQTDSDSGPLQQPTWERDVLAKLASEALKEQRRSRRWSVFFRLAFLGYFVLLTVLMLPDDFSIDSSDSEKHTALVRLEGVISDQSEASARLVVKGLKAAFADKDSAAVVLKINSPGGSPVQAGGIHDEILRLRNKYPDIPLYTVIEDICASGGYYVAVASDRIFANRASIVGSIGVLMNSFGFVDAMEKVGIQRRLLTAGEHKGFMDPFSPLTEDAKSHLEGLLHTIHQQFVDVVKQGRGGRLSDDQDLFTGLVWTGQQGVELGLVDELASLGTVARDIVKEQRVVDFTVSHSYVDRFSRSLGASISEPLVNQLRGESAFLLQ